MDKDYFFDEFFGDFFNKNYTEKDLDDMWREYCKTDNSLKYQNAIQTVKNSGRRVFRNSQGKHKII